MAENLTFGFYEDIYGALRGFVSFAGGSRVVGKQLFPSKSEDKAAAWLDDCLNPERAAKLSPEEFLHLVKLARGCGFHGLMEFIGDETGYETKTREPKDELKALYSQFIASVREMNRLSERIDRAQARASVRGIDER